MKTILKAFLYFLLVFSIFYLLGAFTQASFNIKLWSSDARAFVSMCTGLFGILVIGMCILTPLED